LYNEASAITSNTSKSDQVYTLLVLFKVPTSSVTDKLTSEHTLPGLLPKHKKFTIHIPIGGIKRLPQSLFGNKFITASHSLR